MKPGDRVLHTVKRVVDLNHWQYHGWRGKLVSIMGNTAVMTPDGKNENIVVSVTNLTKLD